jgi:hypothetical protein
MPDEVVDFGKNRILLIKNSEEDKYLFNQGSGYTCRSSNIAYGKLKITNKFQKLFLSQQQLQLSKRCIDQKR